MSRPFHSRITRQNRSKNERAMPKGSKIPFLGLDAKGPCGGWGYPKLKIKIDFDFPTIKKP